MFPHTLLHHLTMKCTLRLLTALVSLTTVVQGFVPAQRFTVHPTKFQLHKKGPLVAVTSTANSESEEKQLIGDDSAYFSIKEQKLGDWITFSAATGFVLVALSFLWFLPFGPHWGDAYLEFTQSAIGTTDSALSMFALLSIFAVSHSGLAGLRPYAEEVVGARAWRVLFACVSLPLALSSISYFVNHAHDGTQLWDITGLPGLHTVLWVTNFVSFLFLYPSTFNLLEIAAVNKPQLHLWETGIIRITRHPQAIGQIMWCIAHTAWLGTDTALAASTVLVLHHVFSMWHGDRRLKRKHGETFELIKEKTSIVPFAAIFDGRQQLPDDYWREFLRGPYAIVVAGTIAAYFAHPYMQAGAAALHW
jgi:zeta-carotene isomerase